jgi:small subunit ribosomal protein S1
MINDDNINAENSTQVENSTPTENSVTEQTNAANAGDTTQAEENSSMQTAQTVENQSAKDDAQSSNEMDFGAILEKFEQEQTTYHTGELVEGKVVGVIDRGVLIDFGYKSEGIAPVEEFMSHEGEVLVKPGDDVEVVIRSIHSGDAPPILSRFEALARKSWEAIEKAFNDETPITGRVVEKTKGGLKVDIDGVEAFLPGSQVDSRPIRNLDSFLNQDIEAKIIKCSRKRNNIVLSRKALTDEVVNKQKAETLSQVEEGYVVDGTVKNLTEYGAFVDIGGIDGLLHVTDISWGRILNPGEQLKVGDTIQVKVLKLDREKEKVSLGYKQLFPDPWSTVMEVYPLDAKLKGRVSSVTDYGAFIELEPGVEGLVHVSEMSWSKRAKSPKKMMKPGDEVDVQVLGIDTNDRRISLGMKQLQENPWDTIADRYHVGSTVHGRVRNLTDFGAFVEIEEGVDGLVHVSDISHSKKIKHPKDVLKKDQEVEAVITSIDTRGHRLSLSIKELTPSAWDNFVSQYKPGDVVRGKISRFAGFGVFVHLSDELEGLCHISELSDDRVEKPEDVVALGQEMDFKILRIESDVQKIGLSARAVGKEEEPVIDTKLYSTEAKSGMASLGELMNLKRGGEEAPVAEEVRPSKKERKAQREMERSEESSSESTPETVESAQPNDNTQNEISDGDATSVAATGETDNQSQSDAHQTEVASTEATSASADDANLSATPVSAPSDDAAETNPTEAYSSEQTTQSLPEPGPPTEQNETTNDNSEEQSANG